MKQTRFSHRISLFLLATLIIISCSITGSPISTVPSQPTDTQAIETQPEDTEIAQPSVTTQFTLTAVQEITATSPGPSCTVLQDLFMRFGPGTAYRPPTHALPANTVVIPLGFAPQGIPEGSWAFVEDPATRERGWVNARSTYISCNIELSTLPPVDFGTPPPPPLPNSTQTSNPDGNGFCVDPSTGYQCVGIFSDESLFQFQILKDGVEVGELDNVVEVSFAVKQNDNPIYENVEVNKAFCIFGGNGPCSPWVVEDGVYKWTPGGTPVAAGEYEMEIYATVNDPTLPVDETLPLGQAQSRWAVTFTLTLPSQ
jgi:hypothetical protein